MKQSYEISSPDTDDPCRRCGACCATYRVTMPREEVDPAHGKVPLALVEPYTKTTYCMREDPATAGRCIALVGEIGKRVYCSIYDQRPMACREFGAYARLGLGDEACNEARRRHGLPPLRTL